MFGKYMLLLAWAFIFVHLTKELTIQKKFKTSKHLMTAMLHLTVTTTTPPPITTSTTTTTLPTTTTSLNISTTCPNNEGVCYNGEWCYQFYAYCYFPDCVRTNACPDFHCPWWYACTVGGNLYADYNTAGGPVHYYIMPSTTSEIPTSTTTTPFTTTSLNITTYCENNEAVCYNNERCYKLHAPCYRPECFFNGQCPDYECPWWWACTYNGQEYVNFDTQGPVHYYVFPNTTTEFSSPSPTTTPA